MTVTNSKKTRFVWTELLVRVLFCWHFVCIEISSVFAHLMSTLPKYMERNVSSFLSPKAFNLKCTDLKGKSIEASFPGSGTWLLHIMYLFSSKYLNTWGEKWGKYYSCKISQQRLHRPQHMCVCVCITHNMLDHQIDDHRDPTINGGLCFRITRVKIVL